MNNYNDLLDLDAAMEVEKLVEKRAIPTWFFPMECAKAKVKSGEVLRSCPWDFTTEELIRIKEAADGPINVFYPNETSTAQFKEMVIEEISQVLSPINEKTIADIPSII